MFLRAFLRAASESAPTGRWAALLRSEAGPANRVTGRGFPALALAASQLTAATVLLALTAPVTARQPVTLTAVVTVSVLALGLLGTGAAYVLNYRLIADEGPTAASTVTYLLPVVAITLGIAVLGEAVSWTLFAGTALVLLGIAISERRLPGHHKRRLASRRAHPGRTSTKPAALKSPSKASASRMRRRRMTAKLVASTKEYSRSSWRRSQRHASASVAAST